MVSHKTIRRLSVVAVCVFAIFLAGAIVTTAAPTATSPAASKPATQAIAPAAYPSPELKKQCEKAAKEMAGRLDDTFTCVIEPPFVVFGNYDARQVRQSIDACITGPSKAMWAAYFEKKPDQTITVLLMNDDKSYRYWADKLFDDKDVSHFGYYKPDKRTMVMNISTGGGTLIHELTHALIVYDFPDVPQWFNEGLGSLHEGCRVGQDDIVGVINWRLPALKAAIAAGKLRPLKEMVTVDDFYGKLRDLNYAQSRYFVMYLQSQGLLKKFYRHYRDYHDGDDAAVKAIETVTGKKIGEVEKAYIEYVKTLKTE